MDALRLCGALAYNDSNGRFSQNLVHSKTKHGLDAIEGAETKEADFQHIQLFEHGGFFGRYHPCGRGLFS